MTRYQRLLFGMFALCLIAMGALSIRSAVANSAALNAQCSRSDMRRIITLQTATDGRWNDTFDVAETAPRIALAPLITQLQATRRDYEAAPYPACGAAIRRHEIAGMNAGIAGFLAFLGNADQSTVQADFTTSAQEFGQSITATLSVPHR